MKREVEEVKEREEKSDNLKEKKEKLADRSLPIHQRTRVRIQPSATFIASFALNCLQKRRKEAVYEAPIDIEIGRDKETQT